MGPSALALLFATLVILANLQFVVASNENNNRPAPRVLKTTSTYSRIVQFDVIPYRLLSPDSATDSEALNDATSDANIFSIASGRTPQSSAAVTGVAGLSMIFYSSNVNFVRSSLVQQTENILQLNRDSIYSEVSSPGATRGYLNVIVSHSPLSNDSLCAEHLPLSSFLRVRVSSTESYTFKWLTRAFFAAQLQESQVYAVYPTSTSAGRFPVDVFCLLVDPSLGLGGKYEALLDISPESQFWKTRGLTGYTTSQSGAIVFFEKQASRVSDSLLYSALFSDDSNAPQNITSFDSVDIPVRIRRIGELPEFSSANGAYFSDFSKAQKEFLKLGITTHEIGTNTGQPGAELELGRMSLAIHARFLTYDSLSDTVKIAWEFLQGEMIGIPEGIAVLWIFVLLLRRTSSRGGDLESVLLFTRPTTKLPAHWGQSSLLDMKAFPSHKTFIVFDPMIGVIAIVAFFWNVGKGSLLGPSAVQDVDVLPYQVYLYAIFGAAFLVNFSLVISSAVDLFQQETPASSNIASAYIKWVAQKSAWSILLGRCFQVPITAPEPGKDKSVTVSYLVRNLSVKLSGYIICAVTTVLLFSWNTRSTFPSVSILTTLALLQIYYAYHALECIAICAVVIICGRKFSASFFLYTIAVLALTASNFALLHIHVVTPFIAMFADTLYSVESLGAIVIGAWCVSASLLGLYLLYTVAKTTGHGVFTNVHM